MKKTRKILILALALVIGMATFCACDPDWYDGRRPTDQPGTKWVCEDYDISFEVNSQGRLENAVFRVDGKEIYFDFLWAAMQVDGVPDAIVWDTQTTEESTTIFAGDCKFRKTYFEIMVDYDPYDYFPDSCTLHFDRVDE